jgi:hypothetical protein
MNVANVKELLQSHTDQLMSVDVELKELSNENNKSSDVVPVKTPDNNAAQ